MPAKKNKSTPSPATRKSPRGSAADDKRDESKKGETPISRISRSQVAEPEVLKSPPSGKRPTRSSLTDHSEGKVEAPKRVSRSSLKSPETPTPRTRSKESSSATSKSPRRKTPKTDDHVTKMESPPVKATEDKAASSPSKRSTRGRGSAGKSPDTDVAVKTPSTEKTSPVSSQTTKSPVIKLDKVIANKPDTLTESETVIQTPKAEHDAAGKTTPGRRGRASKSAVTPELSTRSSRRSRRSDVVDQKVDAELLTLNPDSEVNKDVQPTEQIDTSTTVVSESKEVSFSDKSNGTTEEAVSEPADKSKDDFYEEQKSTVVEVDDVSDAEEKLKDVEDEEKQLQSQQIVDEDIVEECSSNREGAVKDESDVTEDKEHRIDEDVSKDQVPETNEDIEMIDENLPADTTEDVGKGVPSMKKQIIEETIEIVDDSNFNKISTTETELTDHKIPLASDCVDFQESTLPGSEETRETDKTAEELQILEPANEDSADRKTNLRSHDNPITLDSNSDLGDTTAESVQVVGQSLTADDPPDSNDIKSATIVATSNIPTITVEGNSDCEEVDLTEDPMDVDQMKQAPDRVSMTVSVNGSSVTESDKNDLILTDGDSVVDRDSDKAATPNFDKEEMSPLLKRKIHANDECDPSSKKLKQEIDAESGLTEEILASYVVVDSNEIPSADSADVQAAIPQNGEHTPEYTADVSHIHPSLLNRRTINNPSINPPSIDAKRTFGIVSYNILADCYMTPIPADASDLLRRAYGRSYRHNCLMHELSTLDFDILCLQEVGSSYYFDTLNPAMERLGFLSSFKKRTFDNHDSGCATFYRTSRFDLINVDSVTLSASAEKDITMNEISQEEVDIVRKFLNQPDVVLFNQLRCKNSNQLVTVGNIHVTYLNQEYPNIQALQIACAFRELLERCDGGKTAHVLCGDFNQATYMPGYQLACDGYLKNEMIDYLQKYSNVVKSNGSATPLINILWRSYQHAAHSIKSAYLTAQGAEPQYTRFLKDVSLDYIFYSSSVLQVLNVLEVPTFEPNYPIRDNSPNPEFHTDHFSMKATLSFK